MPTDPPASVNWAGAPSTDPEEIRLEYRQLAGVYDAANESWDSRPPRDGARLFANHVPKEASILDAGCGTGLSGQALHDLGFGALHGADLSPEMLDVARGKRVYTQLEVVDLTRPLPFKDHEFDAVYCLGVLTHIEDVSRLMREFCRVTRSGGAVFFSHRNDLITARGCERDFKALEEAGIWGLDLVSEPQLLLPGNPDYGQHITVQYHLYRVR